MNLQLIPLSMSFTGFAEVADVMVFYMVFYSFSLPAITANIFTITTKSKDTSAPVFSQPCTVQQAVGRAPTSPGVMISYNANDMETKVMNATWYAGSTLQGADIVPETVLDSSLQISFQPLNIPSATQVFFTVKACNPDNYCSTSSCQLSSWDLNPTTITAEQNYAIQSHPSEIEGAFSVKDESAVLQGTLQWAYGTTAITVEKLNNSNVGSDVTSWQVVNVTTLSNGPYATLMNGIPAVIDVNFLFQHNQIYFLNVKAQNQLLYVNAQASKGVLIDLTPPFPAQIIDQDRCSQTYINLYSSASVIEDLSFVGPYNAGVLGCEWASDNTTSEYCAPTHIIDWMSTALNNRCIGPTFLPNLRQVKDSGSIFNGDIPGFQKLYQLEQTFVSLNW